MQKKVSVALIVGMLSFIGFVGTHAQGPHPAPDGGEEWLSWSPDERLVFVGAYLEGYFRGKSDACIAAGELFEQGKAITDLAQMPDRRCFRHAKDYSRGAADYASVITQFYEKHPEHRNIPMNHFMLLFTDSHYQTVADIEEGIKRGDVRTTF